MSMHMTMKITMVLEHYNYNNYYVEAFYIL